MTDEAAARYKLCTEPQLSLDNLRSLRAEIDALLSFLQSDSKMEKAANGRKAVGANMRSPTARGSSVGQR
jgi:hypothetical protein